MMDLNELPAVLEALIFASSEPLSVSAIKEMFDRQGYEFSAPIFNSALEDLQLRWGKTDQGLELVQLAGGYMFRTSMKHGATIRALLQEKPQKLAPSQLEVLAIVAYRQPVTRLEIEEVRGVDSSAAVRRLLGLKLLKILGKSQGLGRPLLYGTTKQFLEFFGLNSLHDLPNLKEYLDLNKDATAAGAESVDEPMTLKDLFQDAGSDLFSAETEKRSEDALLALEKALGAVAEVRQDLPT
jgi:segregation and condensation protein B